MRLVPERRWVVIRNLLGVPEPITFPTLHERLIREVESFVCACSIGRHHPQWDKLPMEAQLELSIAYKAAARAYAVLRPEVMEGGGS